MKLTEEDKKNILNFLLNQLASIASKVYQKRVWICGEGPECDSFSDTVCNFLHEADSILKNYKEFNLSDDQYYLLSNFRNIFREFSENNDFPEEFINSEEWDRIVRLSNNVLESFDYKKTLH